MVEDVQSGYKVAVCFRVLFVIFSSYSSSSCGGELQDGAKNVEIKIKSRSEFVLPFQST